MKPAWHAAWGLALGVVLGSLIQVGQRDQTSSQATADPLEGLEKFRIDRLELRSVTIKVALEQLRQSVSNHEKLPIVSALDITNADEVVTLSLRNASMKDALLYIARIGDYRIFRERAADPARPDILALIPKSSVPEYDVGAFPLRPESYDWHVKESGSFVSAMNNLGYPTGRVVSAIYDRDNQVWMVIVADGDLTLMRYVFDCQLRENSRDLK